MKFRIDRFLSIYFFRPIMKIDSYNRKNISILMYHSISNQKSKQNHPYYETATSIEIFEKHLRHLKEKNYKVVSLKDIKKLNSRKKKEKLVVITFDDGFKDFKINAYPLLQKYNFSATVFLPTGLVGKSFLGHELLKWSDIRKLNGCGVTFGSHSKTHSKLVEIGRRKLNDEINHSKKEIENEIGEKVDSFSYPFAFPENDVVFCNELLKALEKYGYTIGVTTKIGNVSINDNMFFLKRLPINSYDDIKFFETKLDGGYNWLHKAQLTSKKLNLRKR